MKIIAYCMCGEPLFITLEKRDELFLLSKKDALAKTVMQTSEGGVLSNTSLGSLKETDIPKCKCGRKASHIRIGRNYWSHRKPWEKRMKSGYVFFIGGYTK